MLEALAVVHYLNQFFGQLRGEEQADAPPRMTEGFVRPGQVLRAALGGSGKVVATVICGDNYFAEKLERASREVLDLIRKVGPQAVVACPAFEAGRYGLACGEVRAAQRSPTWLHPPGTRPTFRRRCRRESCTASRRPCLVRTRH